MSRSKVIRAFFPRAALCALCIASGCATAPLQNRDYALPPDFVPARHVVFIGLDGWGAVYVPKANMPTVKRMMAEGASSLDVLSVMPSMSWPNWSSLFCGAPPEHRTGDARREASENKAAKVIDDFPSIFTVVKNVGSGTGGGKAQGGQAAANAGPVFFYEWNELTKICPDETAEKRRITSDIESARKVAAHIIEKKPVFTAVAFNEPDATGHAKHWGSPAYYAALEALDSYIAVIEQAVKDAGIYDSTVFVLSSDHGGNYWGHGNDLPSMRKIPLVIYGKGITKGFTIPSPAGICDIAPTMAAILGLPIPREWTGRPLLEIFR